MVIGLQAGDNAIHTQHAHPFRFKQVVPYAPPTPPKGTHRYIFSAFEQPGGASLSIHAPAARGSFHTQRFAKAHGLELVGATYFTAAHQE